MILIEILFWLSCALVIYPYVAYPLLLHTVNRIRYQEQRAIGEHAQEKEASVDTLPSLTLIISAYNEQSVIKQKLRNCSQLDYPAELLDVLVVSDGSTDATGKIVKQYADTDTRVRLHTMGKQSGKTAGLNEAVLLARGEILVFSDANAMYSPDALVRLVAPFSESDVGYTVGSALYHDDEEGAVNISEGLYWKYELWIKKLESDFYSVVGGDGAIYAIRRNLFQPLENKDISDFVNPLQIVAAGYRGVFLPEARSYEGGTEEFADEFRRKRRIVNRSWSAVNRYIKIFSWKRHKKFLFMLVSHKVIRWLSCFFVVFALATSSVLAATRSDSMYFWLTATISATILTGFTGWVMDRRGLPIPKVVYLIYYFYLVGLASLLGIADYQRGKTYTAWRHVR